MQICARVALAVQAAHRAAILHRDIKPENVVVADDLTVKVVDFGIARRLQAEVAHPDPVAPPTTRATELVDAFTRTLPAGVLATDENDTLPSQVVSSLTQTVFGTPAYIAPEVLMGAPSSPASDVYSLGVMLYECVAGKRPFEATRLHELLARVIEGSEKPVPLEHVLAELVGRMLARAPADRPTLEDIASHLSRLTPQARARRRMIRVAAAAIVGSVIATGVFVWTRSPPDIVTFAVADIPANYPSYGPSSHPLSFGPVLAATLGAVDRVVVLSPTELHNVLDSDHPTRQQWVDAAREKARYLVTGQIDEANGMLVPNLQLLDLATNTNVAVTFAPTAINVSGGDREALTTTPRFVADLADGIVGAVRDGAHLDRSPNHLQALNLFNKGYERVSRLEWLDARLFLEQAAYSDPDFFEAWAEVASVRAWLQAPKTAVIGAIERALEIPHESDERRQVLQGAAAFYANRYREAIAGLERLAPTTNKDLTLNVKRDALYYLGEAYWHRGQLDRGFDNLVAAHTIDPKFKAASVHAGEYTLARRRLIEASGFFSFWVPDERMSSKNYLQFASGKHDKTKYKTLADDDNSGFQVRAAAVLGRPFSQKMLEGVVGADRAAYQIARALGSHDEKAASREFAEVWPKLTANVTGNSMLQIDTVAEVVVAGELADESRIIFAYLAKHATTFGAGSRYKRLAILATLYVGGPIPFKRDEVDDLRLVTLIDAVEAELAGDRARAVERFQELVGNPSSEWDYVERRLLLRDLRALGRTAEAHVLCEDTMSPAIFRMVYVMLRAACPKEALSDSTPTAP